MDRREQVNPLRPIRAHRTDVLRSEGMLYHRDERVARSRAAGLYLDPGCAMLRVVMGSTSSKRTNAAPLTLQFEKFWSWLNVHANCILRAGTHDAVLFDHEDYHWHLTAEDDLTLIVQLVRGKELVGEIVIASSEIAYVQCEPGEGDEFLFECVVENMAAREVAYHFVLAHGYEEREVQSARRWTH